MQYEFQLTTRVLFGPGTITKVGEQCRRLNGKNVLVVTDPGIISAGHLDTCLQALEKESIHAHVFSEVEENPTTDHVDKGVQYARSIGQLDLIIGLGGGSSMDCAKGINFILTNGGQMADYWGIGKATQAMLPAIGIPTTAGTGSEAQSFALISQSDTHTKMACGDKKALFHFVILDPTLLASVPHSVAVAAGIDAVSHAVESYVTTRKSPFSQMLSREAWRLLEKSFEKSLAEPDAIETLGEMQLGAHLAGAAIENCMLGAAHACANPLTARFGVTHGIAVAIMLPHVVRFNGRTVNGSYGELLAIAGLHNSHSDDSAGQLADRLQEMNKIAAIPHRLRDVNVSEGDLAVLAKQALDQWTGTFNPCSVGEPEFLDLYQSAF